MDRATPLVLCFVVALLVPDEVVATTGGPVAVHVASQSDTRVAARKKRRRKAKKKRTTTPAPPLADLPAPPDEPDAPPAGVPGDLPPPPALPTKYRAVAVLPVQGLDVREELVREVERALFFEVDETPGLHAVSPADVLNDLQTSSLDPTKCDGDVRCLAICGRYARSHLAIESRVAALGGTISVSLRLVDTEAESELGRVAEPVSEDQATRAREMHRLAVQLLTPEQYVGSLMIKSSVDGAEVYIDDKLIGTTPLDKPLESLAAGPHILRISKPGFADVNQFVDVVYKRSSTVNVDLTNATIAGVIVEAESKTGFGSIYVACNVDGVEIRVDGEPVGKTILAHAIEKVAAGKRRVSLRLDGVDPLATEIEVVPDRRTDIGVTVDETGLVLGRVVAASASAPLPAYDDLVQVASITSPGDTPGPRVAPPWTPTWKMYTGIVVAGLGAVSLGASGYFGNRVDAIQQEYDRIYRDLQNPPIEDEAEKRKRYDELEADGLAAQLNHFITLGVGVGLVGIGGGLILWDLFSEPEPRAPPETSVTTMARGLELGVAPAAGGAQVVIGGTW